MCRNHEPVFEGMLDIWGFWRALRHGNCLTSTARVRQGSLCAARV